MTAGVGAVTNTMAKIVGAQVLKDLQMFVAAFDTLFGGFRNRAQQTYELLQTKETAFLVVAAPEAGRAARGGVLRRAARLGADAARRAGGEPGHARGLEGLSAEQAVAAAERLESAGGAGARGSTAGLLRLHADRMRRVTRETPAARAVPGGAPARADGRRAGTVHRRARPRRAPRVGDLLAG